MKTIVIFGAGNIGRGFIGELFFNAGCEIVFVDVIECLINQLRESGRYTLRLAGRQIKDRIISGFRIVSAKDTDAVASERQVDRPASA